MENRLELREGSRVAVVGGGPGGTLAAYFLLESSRQAGFTLHVDLFEPRDYSLAGPAGCNMCGGVISESLVQIMAAEGIRLPQEVILETIDAYTLHTEEGSVRIDAANKENRIASIFRGGGPKGVSPGEIMGFDAHLLNLARKKGARHVAGRVTGIAMLEGRPRLTWKDNQGEEGAADYDLLVGAVGVNGAGSKLFEPLGFVPGRTVRGYVTELHYGRQWIRRSLGRAMHVFLLNIPGLEFAAVIPKGDHVTFIILGEGIDKDMVERVMYSPQVRAILPQVATVSNKPCVCLPRISVGAADNPWSDRVVMVGDCAVSRLYKDGIGASFRTAKACAQTAVYHGISRHDFETHYGPTVRRLAKDNHLGWRVFALVGVAKRWRMFRRIMLATVREEQQDAGKPARLSDVLWDVFTGSAPYGDILSRTLHPRLLFRLLRAFFKALPYVEQDLMGNWKRHPWSVLAREDGQPFLGEPALGTVFNDGHWIVREGEQGNCMYVILEGLVEIHISDGHGPEKRLVRVAVLERDNIFGTQAVFESAPRPYAARALGTVRVISVDHKGLMRRIHEDPSLAVRIIVKLSERIRSLHESFAGMEDAREEKEP